MFGRKRGEELFAGVATPGKTAVDIGDSLNVLENSLRDVVELVLRKAHGDNWFEHLGVTKERIKQWKARHEEEPKRRPGGEVEDRLLYYSEFYDVVEIIKKNWGTGFKDCFQDKKRFDVYTDRLAAFRNPDAHSRALLPFEKHLLLGMTGELRQVITLFLSSGAGGPEPEHSTNRGGPRMATGRESLGRHLVQGGAVSRDVAAWGQSLVRGQGLGPRRGASQVVDLHGC